MKVVGLITEYNPFHNGHLYHLHQSKLITNSTHSICVMSGQFLQRGEPAMVDKWARSKMAVESGIDLVLELPTVYACQSAEIFAYGAINLLHQTGIVDSVSFGSEWGNIEDLKTLASILSKEPSFYREQLHLSLNKGFSYPSARSIALKSYLTSIDHPISKEVGAIINNPNNILAIEYLKALYKLDSPIEPHTIHRIANDYHDSRLSGEISSATAIRNEILTNNSWESIQDTLPISSYRLLTNFYSTYDSFNRLENFEAILMYKLRTTSPEALSGILGVDEGLHNRIIHYSNHTQSIPTLLSAIKTKRYTYTKLQRIMVHLLLDITKNVFQRLYLPGPQYLRVLASNQNGLQLLKEIKKTSHLPIITKFSKHRSLPSPSLQEMIQFDQQATNIYYLGLKNKDIKNNLDYLITPYIKRSKP